MTFKRRTRSAGFTLIELMVVIFIVGILSAVAIPLMRGRADSAKWSEGRTAAGSIRTAARAFCAEKGSAYPYAGTPLCDLGFDLRSCPAHVAGAPSDLDGRYFTEECYIITWNGYNDFLIAVDAAASLSGDAPSAPLQATMDDAGAWTD
jgi:prepilin-type N-terminal cleavage/methylation domain-containing protein